MYFDLPETMKVDVFSAKKLMQCKKTNAVNYAEKRCWHKAKLRWIPGQTRNGGKLKDTTKGIWNRHT